jgi:alkanesulfonate monooxygenase SsuD/methylene tetrahydromethanopterin reductase-like flavin-dependent oxidoreductase (luciferase family)
VGDAIPFRFGANALRAASRAEWFDNARRVEDLGYAVLAVPDHLAERLAPLPALVSAASVTTRLRLVTDDRRQAAEDLARTWTA